jgi:hypothetical protein
MRRFIAVFWFSTAVLLAATGLNAADPITAHVFSATEVGDSLALLPDEQPVSQGGGTPTPTTTTTTSAPAESTETSTSASDASADCPFGGLWDTTYGRMELHCDGDQVLGTYAYSDGSSIVGTVEEGRLTFRYTEPQAQGEGWFELGDAGAWLNGEWRADGSTDWSPWTGTRVVSVDGRVWLVVLEAQWENDLAEPEYAFGDMLRAWFARHPHVQVRHRRIHDLADFRAAMSEVGMLAEPTVVLLASHGSSGALTIGPDRIGATEVAEAIGSAPNVMLVHFSSCEVAMNRTLEQVREAVPESRSLVVSGYDVSVDWAASAIVEMLYLDHVLGRRMPPAAAAELIGRELNFTGTQVISGSPLGAAEFRWVD